VHRNAGAVGPTYGLNLFILMGMYRFEFDVGQISALYRHCRSC